jgi:hypothetical protein
MSGRERLKNLKSRRVVHKSTGGTLRAVPEPVDLVGNAPSSNTVAHLASPFQGEESDNGRECRTLTRLGVFPSRPRVLSNTFVETGIRAGESV